MKNILIIFVLLLSTPLVLLSQNHLPDSTCIKLREIMQGFKERYHSPSVTVVVVHDNDIVFGESLGYADLEKQIPASIHSLYPIMSVTKVFTATMLMQLKEKGKLKLDDNVKQYIPEFKDYRGSSPTSEITLLQLATHTAGLPRNPPSDIHFTQEVDKWLLSGGNTSIPTLSSTSTKEMLQSLTYIENEYPEYDLMRYGDRHYSNLGYALLGIALEKAGKTNYISYVTQHILSPLKMEHSGFITESSSPNNLVSGYWYNPITERFVRTPFYEPQAMTPAGGIYSTAADLAKFLSFQFRQDSPNEILSNDSKAMMRAFNIGWKPSYPFVLHEGAMLGHRCEIAFNPNLKIGWIILTNTTDFVFSKMNDMFAQIITPYYEAKPVTNLSKYVGTYHLKGGYGSLKIYQKGDSLYSSYLSDLLPETPLVPLGNNRFNEKAGDTHSIGYEFIITDQQEKILLNMGQLVWTKE